MLFCFARQLYYKTYDFHRTAHRHSFHRRACYELLPSLGNIETHFIITESRGWIPFLPSIDD